MTMDFHDEEARRVWSGGFPRRLPNQIQAIAGRKLRMQEIRSIHSGEVLRDKEINHVDAARE